MARTMPPACRRRLAVFGPGCRIGRASPRPTRRRTVVARLVSRAPEPVGHPLAQLLDSLAGPLVLGIGGCRPLEIRERARLATFAQRDRAECLQCLPVLT